MSKTKSTKSALLMSFTSLLLCFAMLIGSTFAWFTDSATASVNKIQAGTLDVQLLDEQGTSLEGQTLTWQKAAGAPANEQVLWEPGCTYKLQPIVIKNNGSLALKYKIQITGIQGDAKLNEAIEWTITNNGQTYAVDQEVSLAAGASATLTISGHMKETAGNEYQGLSIDNIAITVAATQDTVEYDSNNNQYDANAEYAIPVATAAELAVALAEGKDVVLTAPIQMPAVIEIKNDVTIYGGENGQLLVPDNADRVINITDTTEPVTLTLSNVDVVGPTTGGYTRGVSVYDNSDVTIVADNSSVSANYYALNIASANDNVKAVIKNTTLTGWCAFQTWSAGTKATFENCTLIGNNDKGYNADGWNNFATVVINEGTTGVDLTFNNCRIEANQTTGNKQYLLSVRASGAKVTLNNCTFFADGTAIADEDLGNYLNIYSVASDLVLTIDGSVIPIE
ncbi:MAG: SipW-dependent-type signal peptide-containing protein [Oscillospiraceae bacterium]|nr:SipW-dependent-type signal peptide-containing protein [Oscillospiraceae bacterium]